MKQISILGCGWLGLPLAKSLIEKHFSVNGSTTSIDKISNLKSFDINSFLIQLNENNIKGEIDFFLENSKILIIDIPPKLRSDFKENYVSKIKILIPFIEKSSIKKVIFVSSTSVYADDNKTITEKTIAKPDTESGKQLLDVEQLLQSNKNFKTTIIRFGGLIGNDRHPIKFLSGRKNIENPESPVNLIHQEDCIGIILKIIEIDSWNQTFNAVAPYHPTRKVYYTQKATTLNFPLPEFNDTKPSIGKLVLSTNIDNILGYDFKHSKF